MSLTSSAHWGARSACRAPFRRHPGSIPARAAAPPSRPGRPSRGTSGGGPSSPPYAARHSTPSSRPPSGSPAVHTPLTPAARSTPPPCRGAPPRETSCTRTPADRPTAMAMNCSTS
uniref:Uncharacterized protein n=1 Tax=Arundo donax TaxID=35708 RepID=A0A0A9A262_ARUDO